MTTAAPQWVLLVQAGATWFMTGVIWFVQVVHYPLLAGVGRAAFTDYEARNTARTARVVGPAMLVELAAASWIAWRPPAGVPAGQAWVGLALLTVIWLSTGLLQVPQHRVLERGFDSRAHARLVSTNWLRVVAWSGRSLLVALWLA